MKIKPSDRYNCSTHRPSQEFNKFARDIVWNFSKFKLSPTQLIIPGILTDLRNLTVSINVPIIFHQLIKKKKKLHKCAKVKKLRFPMDKAETFALSFVTEPVNSTYGHEEEWSLRTCYYNVIIPHCQFQLLAIMKSYSNLNAQTLGSKLGAQIGKWRSSVVQLCMML